MAWQLVIALTGSSEALQREITVVIAERTIMGLDLDRGCCERSKDKVEDD